MVSIVSLWLPILVSAVLVFVASSIIHMALPYHKSDYKRLPNEDKFNDAMRGVTIPRGDYLFPHATSFKDAASPEMQKKFESGPVGFMTIMPNGVPQMGKPLIIWFIYSLGVGLFAGYVGSATLPAGVDYLKVFQVVGATAILGYSAAHVSQSIWKGQPWPATAKHVFDGVIYGLLTAGTFGWLWPQ